MINNSSKQKLMRAYQAYSFAVYDILLYLDAYPNCREAIQTYNKYMKMATKAKAEYESMYGPITAPTETECWDWTSAPWPWQIGEER